MLSVPSSTMNNGLYEQSEQCTEIQTDLICKVTVNRLNKCACQGHIPCADMPGFILIKCHIERSYCIHFKIYVCTLLGNKQTSIKGTMMNLIYCFCFTPVLQFHKLFLNV